MTQRWLPTHLIDDDEWGEELVMLTEDGAAYTRQEWEEEAKADYAVHAGEWLRQGEPFSGTVIALSRGQSLSWQPTHRIIDQGYGVTVVMLHNGVAYSRGEWQSNALARYGCTDGRWYCYGRAFSGFVEKIESGKELSPVYSIQNCQSGALLGYYRAASPDEALDALARDAGYRDRAEAEAVAPSKGQLVVVEEWPIDSEVEGAD